MGTPFLLGNSDMFDNNQKLSKYLILESDDDINEIASKIKIIKSEKDKIISEYKKFREKYSSESKKSIEKLLK